MVGVDAHKASFTYLILQLKEGGSLGEVAQGELPNTADGYAELLQALAGQQPRVFVVENARGYALGLSWHLLQQGQQVYDLPATQVATLRRRRQQAKNDTQDARLAALAWLEHPTQRCPLRLPTLPLQLQSLTRCREGLVQQRLSLQQQLVALQRQPYALAQVRQSLQVVMQSLSQEIAALEQSMQTLLEPYRGLQTETGIGLVSAAVLIGEVQYLERFRDEAAFAAYAATASLDHSSGQRQRVKVNPGGNRRLNRVIELITWNRLRLDPRTQAYHARKMCEGMARRQATRATKRQVTRDVDVYRALCRVLT
ncbi:MAG: hypothetical protein KatS3mg073_0559 [Meiothermus sp.]|uniref:Uncharacterized protein n=2 Tax=Meiothermus hypogaeus TaxID=884155 RepID=A0A511R6N6_9DEIN|nr:Transposase [Meiothermus hypogaeus]GEM85274.1 hypothetical protein MHY01S_34400 [Meiothermus hypogaeus NBRC 106114]GIW36414.1 MAG: hypothetical protein KatS3mg073_0559 [Meiothermus sp.]